VVNRGGLYFWTHRLGPPKYRNLLAWFVGYNSFLGNVAATSSLAWACAGIVFAAVSIADNTFTPTTAQTFGLYVGILLAVGALCAYGSEILIFLQTPNVILNALLILATVIGLPIARRKELNTAEYTLGDFTNLTGWSPGMAFLLSMLAPVWTICELGCYWISTTIAKTPVTIVDRFFRLCRVTFRGGLSFLACSWNLRFNR
jgi:amino acid transporter